MKNGKAIPKMVSGHGYIVTYFIHFVGAYTRSDKYEIQLIHRDVIPPNPQSSEDVDALTKARLVPSTPRPSVWMVSHTLVKPCPCTHKTCVTTMFFFMSQL